MRIKRGVILRHHLEHGMEDIKMADGIAVADHGRPLAWSVEERRCTLMGIINATPDSFSDGGEVPSADAAQTKAQTMLAAGARWLDIGGESTRPGAAPVSEAEELRRVGPAIRAISEGCPRALLSIDTRHGAVAEEALTLGAAMVNDVSGGRDPKLLAAVAAHDAALVLMHMQGDPRTMQVQPSYESVVEEVAVFLLAQLERAVAAGVRREAILIDPGIGFGKSLEHNLALLRGLPRLREWVGRPILLGISRKSFLPALLGYPLEREQRDVASHTLHALLAPQVAVLRCHDVAGARQALALAQAVGHGLMH